MTISHVKQVKFSLQILLSPDPEENLLDKWCCFNGPDALPVIQPTVSKDRRKLNAVTLTGKNHQLGEISLSWSTNGLIKRALIPLCLLSNASTLVNHTKQWKHYGQQFSAHLKGGMAFYEPGWGQLHTEPHTRPIYCHVTSLLWQEPEEELNIFFWQRSLIEIKTSMVVINIMLCKFNKLLSTFVYKKIPTLHFKFCKQKSLFSVQTPPCLLLILNFNFTSYSSWQNVFPVSWLTFSNVAYLRRSSVQGTAVSPHFKASKIAS